MEAIKETGSLNDKELFETIWKLLDECGRKLNKFIQGVERVY